MRGAQHIGMSPSGKAPDFDSGMRRFESCHPCQKSKSQDLDFFICAARHNIVCVAHATSFDRQVNIIAARGTNERGCGKPQMM